MLKKLFINKFLKSIQAKYLRNFFGIRPSYYNIDYNKKNISVSDAFFWRTDSSFVTYFSFTDLMSLFYSISDTEVEIVFFDKNFNFIKKIFLKTTDISNKIIIDRFFLDGIEDYGTFYIFHNTSTKFDSMIRNSCYTGFSYKNALPSFVHGNTQTAYKNLSDNKITYGIGAKSFLKNKIYKVQNYLENDKTEILIMNPCSSKINIKINGKSFNLQKGFSRIFDINKNNEILIISNSYLLRPIVFNYKNNYIDVHHG